MSSQRVTPRDLRYIWASSTYDDGFGVILYTSQDNPGPGVAPATTTNSAHIAAGVSANVGGMITLKKEFRVPAIAPGSFVELDMMTFSNGLGATGDGNTYINIASGLAIYDVILMQGTDAVTGVQFTSHPTEPVTSNTLIAGLQFRPLDSGGSGQREIWRYTGAAKFNGIVKTGSSGVTTPNYPNVLTYYTTAANHTLARTLFMRFDNSGITTTISAATYKVVVLAMEV